MLPTLSLSLIWLYPSLNLTVSPQFFSLSRYSPFCLPLCPSSLCFLLSSVSISPPTLNECFLLSNQNKSVTFSNLFYIEKANYIT